MELGGSLICIGSAAGVALMGQANGKYMAFDHLRWTAAMRVLPSKIVKI